MAEQEVTAQKRVGLRTQELDAEIKAVADAEAYAIEKRANANAQAAIANANADRDSRKAAAQAIEAEGVAEKNRRIAAAEALRAEGDAEAEAIRVKGHAEAESSRAQAEALDERSAELLRQQIIEQLPDIVRAAAEPLAAIQNMTVISSDATGTAQIGQNLESQLATTRQIIKDLVGVDISELITGRAVGQAAGEALAGADGPAAVRRRSSRATNSGE